MDALKEFRAMSHHPALQPGRTAVITGAASGVGLAIAKRFASLGLRICMADTNAKALGEAARAVGALTGGGPKDILAAECDVSQLAHMQNLRRAVDKRFGEVAVLVNNAGIGRGGGAYDNIERWRKLMDVNLWGVINGLQTFTQAMLDQKTPCAIVNTGSKQGITNPPGDAAYNVTKAAIKALTEQLAYQLSNAPDSQVTAHLLVPGYTFTGLTARGGGEKPPGAWSAEQVADALIAAMGRGDFYVLCPDNDVTRAMDEKRIQWAADDLIKNRPALSRWRPDYKDAFEAFMRG
jgi:NAD(P)-dependent dehydrogenase (short-subunit alcohol dehydrogenase family)